MISCIVVSKLPNLKRLGKAPDRYVRINQIVDQLYDNVQIRMMEG